MISIILFCVLSCLFVLWTWLVYGRGKHKLPPFYPGALPIIGHLHKLLGDGTSLWNTAQAIAVETKKQGGVITILLGSSICYTITDPEDALTATNSCLQKHFAYNLAKPWLGEGLITSSGEVWKRHRKLLTPAFSLPVTLNFLDIFNSQSRKLVKNLKVEISKGPFDHNVYLRSIALETFCLTAFGITGFEDDCIKTYMHAVDRILTIVTKRFQNFWLQSEIIFKLTGLKKEHDELIKIINDMSNKVIQEKKTERNNDANAYAVKPSGVRYKPFLDLLLEQSEENALTDKEIREEVDTAIVAGFDTSSTLLTYIMILLGTHPQVQQKIYEEINEVFKTDRDVEKEDLQKLVYMEAVIKESLRIFTAGPVTLRNVDKEVKLKNYTMRPGTQCLVLLFGIHRDSVWGNDVDKFRPERWFENDMPAYPNAFVGFSLGKRSCLGKTYAMISMKTTLAHFVRRYKVQADDSNLKLRFDFILKPVSGHEITLTERV